MKNKVIISIKGIHNLDDNKDNVETIISGKYFNRNGKHYIMYDESLEDNGEINKNTIKISNDIIEITKKGIYNVRMIFEEGKKHISCYNTPFGNMQMAMSTNNINIADSEDEMNIHIDYSIEFNSEHLSDCNMYINVKSVE